MSEQHEHMNKTVVSAEGMKKLEEKLQYLVSVRRAEVAEQISIARGFGDLSENAEYDEAKNEQSRLESEIAELELTIRTATVIDGDNVSTDSVNVGTRVLVQYVDDGEQEEYSIVGARESDPLSNMISNESPIGAALLGKRKGEIALAEVPNGTLKLKVLKISR